jgi:uncharacterized protein involved in response to NO
MINIYRAPFRIFFCLTAIIATLVPMYFVSIMINDYYFQARFFDAFTWHGHEMVFGYTSALLSGFMLTASAHWTGKKTSTPTQLFFMSTIWLLARYLAFAQPSELAILIILPLPFIILLIKMTIILRGDRNFVPITYVLGLISAGQIINLYGCSKSNSDLIEFSYKLATYSIFTLLFFFSGRLITFFTNARFKEKLIALKLRDEFILGGIFSSYFLAYFFSHSTLEIIFASLSFILFVRRSYLLFHKRSLSEPMLYTLHIGHSFFALYFIIRLFNLTLPDYELGRSALHAFFTGTVSIFALAIMSRAVLGHSSRPIKANLLLKLAFASTILGSILRIFIPLIWSRLFDFTLHISMGFWTLGFIFFFLNFFKYFFFYTDKN